MIGCLPLLNVSRRSHVHPKKKSSSSENITLPIFVSVNKHIRPVFFNNAQQWIGRCPGDRPRLWKRLENSSEEEETLKIDSSASIGITQPPAEQKKKRKDRTTVSSMSIVSDVDVQQSPLSHVSSTTFVTRIESVRSKPLSNPTIISGQKPNETFRKRNERSDSETNYYRSTPLFDRNQFIFIQNSSSSENLGELETISALSNNSGPLRNSLQKEDHSLSFPESISSFTMNRIQSRTSPKYGLLFLDDGTDEESYVNALTQKVFKLPLPNQTPPPKESTTKKSPPSNPISLEKKEIRNALSPLLTPLPMKSKLQPTFNSKPIEKSPRPSRNKRIVPNRSTEKKLYEPYVGYRKDPPTPPCSPLQRIRHPERNDQDQTEVKFEQSFLNDSFLQSRLYFKT